MLNDHAAADEEHVHVDSCDTFAAKTSKKLEKFSLGD
jgi:hypothetical protein